MTDKMKKVDTSLKTNVSYLKSYLAVDKSFDLIYLDLNYAGKDMAMFMVDGFVKDDIMLFIMQSLQRLRPDELDTNTLQKLMKRDIPFIEIEALEDMDKLVDFILSGATVLFVEDLDKAIVIDARTYPARSPEEPDLERVVRGPRDGFVETLVFNTALTRRRVRDRSLRMEFTQVGRRSKTDVVISYIEDIADSKQVEKLKKMIDGIDTDGLPMAEKTIEEFFSDRYWNPYPAVRYTERPDTVASHLFEGHIVLIIDGSPSAMITQTTFWQHLQHAEEYRQKPSVGAYLRIVRFIAIFLSLVLLPLYYLFSVQPELLPPAYSFIGPEDAGVIPLLVQFLIAELGLDVLRMASIHTPSALGTALGLVAAIMIGEVSVQVGWFSHEVVLYIATAAIGSYATPSYELSMANRLARLFLLFSTALFGVSGYVIGVTGWLLFLIKMRTFETPYFWPLVPFSAKSMRDTFIRFPLPERHLRPSILRPKDPDR
ncbi:spore germination protein [Oceanobacillus neutriphilus]|uniref:Spore germination protein n=2 Tax=Oceanobacillus neutriphilus TaxID=531815 RepID=A0ABQ2NX54_9BACI|nr:spore germination protein [Oceanobacillus neutriphilus]